MEKLCKDQEKIIQKERKEKCLKKLEKEFKEFRELVQKLNRHKGVTNELLLDAYALAKAIQEKYEYKANPICILESIGIEVDKQLEEKQGDDYGYIEIEESKVTIKYHIFSQVIKNPVSIYGTMEARYTDYTSDHNNEIYLGYYVLVILIMLCNGHEIRTKKKLYYQKSEYKCTTSEEIAQIISYYMLYISYDFKIRTESYWFMMDVVNGRALREMGEVRFIFRQEYEAKAIAYFIIKGKIYEERKRIFTPGGKISNYTIENIRKYMNPLHTEVEEEYKKLSKMDAPEELYARYKNKDYNSFGKTRKIDF